MKTLVSLKYDDYEKVNVYDCFASCYGGMQWYFNA